jgi:flagellar biosynthesis/type III secretory pathway chaperone
MNTKESLKNLFAQHVVNITFKKINNEERKMICTLKPDLLPVQEKKEQTKKKPENDNILPVWDLEQKAFRSFRVDSLIDYSIVKD